MPNLKISTRLAALIGTMALFLLLLGGVGLKGQASSNAHLKGVYEDRTVPAERLGHIQELMLTNQLAVLTALAMPDPRTIGDASTRVTANIAGINKVWEAYMASTLTVAEAQAAREFVALRRTFVEEGLKPALAALQANNLREAQRLATDKLLPLFAPANDKLEVLLQIQVDVAKEEFVAATSEFERARVEMVILVACALLGAALIGFLTVRAIGRQLGAEPGEVLAVTNSIAVNDLTTVITVRKGAEHSVMAGMAAMQTALARVVSQVRQSSDSIATGSAQIATGNADLSQRTEEQASNLQQTAASMEELTSTVKQNSDTARQANQLANSASEAASRGGLVVNQVVSTMQDITASSHKISDIISVIDGIAFQTNILALNAAVEAARAGEQGRGFAVVAAEVRNLAQRSAIAAKEIKTLIGESVQKVEAGSRLADDAGKSMQDIVAQVKRVNDLIAEISSASIEQTQGIAQVGDAVQQLDQVTQQNAALVEESAAAADSLSQQAGRLAAMVSVFKLADGGQPIAASVAYREPPGERRGTARATNVMRPQFANRPVAMAAKAAPATAPAKTGTDDWESF